MPRKKKEAVVEIKESPVEIPREKGRFVGKGLGTSNATKAYGAKFPPHVAIILESLGREKSDYIRRYVEEGLKRDGLLKQN